MDWSGGPRPSPHARFLRWCRVIRIEGRQQKQRADLCDSINYGLTASAKDDPVGPKFLRITDIIGGGIDWSSVPFCEIDPDKKDNYRLIELHSRLTVVVGICRDNGGGYAVLCALAPGREGLHPRRGDTPLSATVIKFRNFSGIIVPLSYPMRIDTGVEIWTNTSGNGSTGLNTDCQSSVAIIAAFPAERSGTPAWV